MPLRVAITLTAVLLVGGRLAHADPVTLSDDCLFAGGLDCDAICAGAAAECDVHAGQRCTRADDCTTQCLVEGGVLICDAEVVTYGNLDTTVAYAEMNGIAVDVPPMAATGGGGIGGKGCAVSASRVGDGGVAELGGLLLLAALAGLVGLSRRRARSARSPGPRRPRRWRRS